MDIDKLIKKTGLSINEMCLITNVDRDTLYKWRAGKQRMSNSTVRLFEIIEWIYDQDLLDGFKNSPTNH